MNKIVIVGNGFDLAHDLPTSYSHILNNFWSRLSENCKDEKVQQLVFFNPGFADMLNYENKITCYTDFEERVKLYSEHFNFKITVTPVFSVKHIQGTQVFDFINEFFKIITLSSAKNWVDIENVYFEILKDLIKKNKGKHTYSKGIKELNEEFEQVKILLENYLINEVINKNDFTKSPANSEEILKFFRIHARNLDENKSDNIFVEFPPEDHSELIEYDKKMKAYFDEYNPSGIDFKFPETLFLDFNYTPTVSNYVRQINSMSTMYGGAEYIQIHGRVNTLEDPINFGFGDEMDDDYKSIENENNNDYLKNIKSFQYLHNSNYRRLLNWIETEKFQVYIFGHSCGLSDRTLLNTIFENKNCRSIKLFFHKSDTDDNYTELTHNISRHFNNKPLMRSKIVDKTICVQLPQNVRFRKK
ncbi:hypothetical protein D3C85_110310 [compost metagenome]